MGSAEREFSLACPGCGVIVACVAVLGEMVQHHCPACECAFDVMVSLPKEDE